MSFVSNSSWILFFEKGLQDLEVRSHYRQSLQHSDGLSSLGTMTGPRCLGVSLLIVLKTEATPISLLMQTLDLKVIRNAKQHRMSHTGLKS